MIRSPVLVVLLFAAVSTAQSDAVEFTELLIDPIGPNAGAQIVEVRSTGVLPANLAGWYLVTAAGMFALPAVVLPPDAIAQLRLGQNGTSTVADLYLPTVPGLGNSGTLALFRSAATGSATDLVDFVAWGGGTATASLAVAAGQWPNVGESIPVPMHEGFSMAHFEHVTYGSRSTPAAWFADGTPTLGGPNDGGGLFAGAGGCSLLFDPQLGSGAEINRPWLGELWHLDTGYLPVLPTAMWVALGFETLGNVSLEPYGITGCVWDAAPHVVMQFAIATYPQDVRVQLPLAPAFVGSALHVQALVQAPGANPAGLLATRSMIALPGLR